MNKTILWVVVILVLVGGGYYFMNMNNTVPAADTMQGMESMPAMDPNMNRGAERPFVMYTDTGFEPKEVSIIAGQNVEFMNHSSRELTVGFGEHLNHSEYPDKIMHPTLKPGGADTITFPATGTYEYHNHLVDEDTGTVIVQ